jgi:hypothetical protein
MICKSFVSVLLFGMMFLGIIGCGDDVEPPVTEPMPLDEDLIGSWEIESVNDGPPLEFLVADEPDEDLRRENSVNNRAPLEFPVADKPDREGQPNNDRPPLEFLAGDEPDGEGRPKINIAKFNYNFDAEGSWTLNLDAEMLGFPEIPAEGGAMVDFPGAPAEGGAMVNFPGAPAKEGKIKIIGMWSGTYKTQDSHLSLNVKEEDLSFTSVPQDYFEKVSDFTRTEARLKLAESFNSHILTTFANTFYTIEEETLNLQSTGSSKSIMVLAKQ